MKFIILERKRGFYLNKIVMFRFEIRKIFLEVDIKKKKSLKFIKWIYEGCLGIVFKL